MALIESLPQYLFNQIALQLEAADLAMLASTSRALNRLVGCDDLWIEKISADFGDRSLIVDLLAEAGVEITELLENSTDIVPWQGQNSEADSSSDAPSYAGHGIQCYRRRFERVFPISNDDSANFTKRAEATLDEVKHLLREGPQASGEVFAEAAYRLMLVQEYFPNSAECYYLWALICFMLNAFNPSLEILSIGHTVNGEFGPIQELTNEVKSIIEGAYGTHNDDAPLINASGSGPSAQLAKALAIIFQRFDKDRDGVLNSTELSGMIRISNGQPVPAAMISQIISAFGGQVQTKSGRRITGWTIESLTSFFVAQTLDDPKETRSDLAKFGFDPRTLKQL
ncbi:hypothetical protein GGI12_000053 [Dipsacomyces acuminosporus]|nr:hypothetical protein GGI12_000053 [Dipsacomyces acuminosporus]